MSVNKKGISKYKLRDIFVVILFFPLVVVILLLIGVAMPFVFLYGLVVWGWEAVVGLPLFRSVKTRIGIASFLLLLTLTTVLFLIISTNSTNPKTAPFTGSTNATGGFILRRAPQAALVKF